MEGRSATPMINIGVSHSLWTQNNPCQHTPSSFRFAPELHRQPQQAMLAPSGTAGAGLAMFLGTIRTPRLNHADLETRSDKLLGACFQAVSKIGRGSGGAWCSRASVISTSGCLASYGSELAIISVAAGKHHRFQDPGLLTSQAMSTVLCRTLDIVPELMWKLCPSDRVCSLVHRALKA